MAYPDDLGPTDGWVYHYTKLQTALEHILPSMRIRLGPLNDTNDPWEGRHDDSFSVSVREKDPTYAASSSALALGMMKPVVGCFCADVPGIDAAEAQRRARSSCGWARDRMWAQYAENHRGVCLCFDREKLLDSVRSELGDEGECLADNVEYSDEQFEAGPLKPDPNEAKARGAEYPRVFRDELARHRYLTKRLDWKGEGEWRIVVLTHPWARKLSWTGGDAFVPIDGALRAIIVGHRFSEAYRPVVRDACARLGIPAFKLRYENGRVALSSRYDVMLT